MKNHYTYSDKFVLSVVDLSSIKLATEEDEACGLVYWARLFKAKTWEELKMLAKGNEYLQEAAESIYIANADDIVRQQCRAREEAERYERTMKRDMQILKETNEQLKEDNEQLKEDNEQLKEDNEQLKEDNEQLKEDIEQLREDNSQLKEDISELKSNMAILIQKLQERDKKE